MPRSSCSRRRAFSLVEVVASLLLVGTLLVGVLVAHRRAASQMHSAQRRLDAVKVLNELLEARRKPDSGDLQLARGKAPGRNAYHWRSTLRRDAGIEAVGAAVITIELYDPEFDDSRTLAAVEMLAPSG